MLDPDAGLIDVHYLLQYKDISKHKELVRSYLFYSVASQPCCSLWSESIYVHRSRFELEKQVRRDWPAQQAFVCVCGWVCILSVHVCSHASLFHLLTACMFCSWWQWSVLLICGWPVVFCAWVVCMWNSFPIQTHHPPPPGPFVGDVSCQQTGRLVGWWRKSQRAEKQTGRSPALLGICLCAKNSDKPIQFD